MLFIYLHCLNLKKNRFKFFANITKIKHDNVFALIFQLYWIFYENTI